MEVRDTTPSLRASLDGKDVFAIGGHQIMKTAGATRHAERMKKVPVWALDDEKIKELINYRFPKAALDPEQRRLASRMIRFIYLYYRTGMTISQVAEQLKMTIGATENLRFRLSKQMSKPLKPSHRPKKGGGIETERGSDELDSEGRHGDKKGPGPYLQPED